MDGPFKDFVFAVGDFNDWTLSTASMMHDVGNGETFWMELTNLVPGQDYRYQYHIMPDDIRVADAYAEVILDQWNDPWIPESTYPNMPAYPANHTSGPVSVFTPGEVEFAWTDDDFERPDQENLVIYELLVRDFSEDRSFQFIIDSLDYLESLGIQALELMPVNEFNGNDSWGYNPTFYFAVDKAYGTKDDLKALVDACHARGIAVILDVVYNHADQPNPFITMYWEDWTVLPYNPWFNVSAPHSFTWFYDWNHGTSRTRDFVKRNLDHWVQNYHIDGFRWDFTQGLVQQQGVDGGYNAQRIQWLKEYGDHVWAQDPSVYMILEHWCDFNEEMELANYNGANGVNSPGFMLWTNATHGYQEASMGYSGNDIGWANFQSHSFQDRHAVAYAESHDEERLMYKNLQYGNSNGDYDASDETIALRRQQLSMAFNLLMPGPRMIWQFEELGYDYSINTCSDGVTVSPDCRVAAKPVRWDYYSQPERKHLYDVSGAFAALKRITPRLDQMPHGSTWTWGATASACASSTAPGTRWLWGISKPPASTWCPGSPTPEHGTTSSRANRSTSRTSTRPCHSHQANCTCTQTPRWTRLCFKKSTSIWTANWPLKATATTKTPRCTPVLSTSPLTALTKIATAKTR